MSKKFKAIIHEIDKDYHAFTGSKDIQVNSWEEAEEYCRKNEWSGHDYYVYGLVDEKKKKGYYSKKEYRDAIGGINK